jgi:hypothetical protein
MPESLVEPVAKHHDPLLLAVPEVAEGRVKVALGCEHLSVAREDGGDVAFDIYFTHRVEFKSSLHYAYELHRVLDVGLRRLNGLVQIARANVADLRVLSMICILRGRQTVSQNVCESYEEYCLVNLAHLAHVAHLTHCINITATFSFVK